MRYSKGNNMPITDEIIKLIYDKLIKKSSIQPTLYKFITEDEILPKFIEKKFYICLYNSLCKGRFKTFYEDGHYRINIDGYNLLSCYRLWPGEIKGYFLHHELREGDIVIDAGAYLGDFSLYAAKVVGNSGKVISFEPHPLSYKKLVDNIKLNKLTNVIPINRGLYSENTNLNLYDSALGTSSIYLSKESQNEEENFNIDVVRLDDQLQKLNVNRVDFIKMDIEGAEIEAIKGCNEILRQNNVNLAIASYHVVNGSMTSGLLEDLLKDMGYQAETTNPDHLTTYGWKPKNTWNE